MVSIFVSEIIFNRETLFSWIYDYGDQKIYIRKGKEIWIYDYGDQKSIIIII